MKFEEQIKKVIETLDEQAEVSEQIDEQVPGTPVAGATPQAGVDPNAPVSIYADEANEEALFQNVGSAYAQATGDQKPTSGKLLSWALKFDPTKLSKTAPQTQPTGATNQVNPAAPSNPQTASAQPASTNTSGTMGATSTGV